MRVTSVPRRPATAARFSNVRPSAYSQRSQFATPKIVPVRSSARARSASAAVSGRTARYAVRSTFDSGTCLGHDGTASPGKMQAGQRDTGGFQASRSRLIVIVGAAGQPLGEFPPTALIFDARGLVGRRFEARYKRQAGVARLLHQ